LNCYQWGSCVGGPNIFNAPIWAKGFIDNKKQICTWRLQKEDSRKHQSSFIL